MRIAAVLWVVALSVLATPVFAKDVCVQDDADVFVFKNARKLKKPGTVAPLVGYMIRDGASYPFVGSAVVGADLRVTFGITVHSLLTLGSDISLTFIGSPDFNANGYTDTDGNGTVNTSDSWTPIDCKPVVLR